MLATSATMVSCSAWLLVCGQLKRAHSRLIMQPCIRVCQPPLHVSNYDSRQNLSCCLSGYIFLVGMLMSQFAISGYDACAHMSEVGVSAQRRSVQALVHVHAGTHSECGMFMYGSVLRGFSTMLGHLLCAYSYMYNCSASLRPSLGVTSACCGCRRPRVQTGVTEV